MKTHTIDTILQNAVSFFSICSITNTVQCMLLVRVLGPVEHFSPSLSDFSDKNGRPDESVTDRSRKPGYVPDIKILLKYLFLFSMWEIVSVVMKMTHHLSLETI